MLPPGLLFGFSFSVSTFYVSISWRSDTVHNISKFGNIHVGPILAHNEEDSTVVYVTGNVTVMRQNYN